MKTLLTATVFTLFICTAHAQAETKVAEQRIERQLKRLAKGQKDGTINPAECTRIKTQLDAQKKRLAEIKSDNKITTDERAEIDNMQDLVSERLFKQKTDGKDKEKKRKKPTGIAS